MGLFDYFKSSDGKNTSNTSSTSDRDVEAISTEAVAKGTNPLAQDTASVRPHTNAVNDERVAFLDSFTPEEQKRIIRKVDHRLLITIGVIYLIKQIDVNNAASVKVLAVGKHTNILKQLNMTSDEYNWVQSIYYVRFFAAIAYDPS